MDDDSAVRDVTASILEDLGYVVLKWVVAALRSISSTSNQM